MNDAPPWLARMASTDTTACKAPSVNATARALGRNLRARWVRWSRPPLRIDTPRRLRETITRHVSSAGIPTRRSATNSDRHATAEVLAATITRTAAAKPIGMLPPSPRKILAGKERLRGRKPRQAPPSDTAPTASHASPRTIPRIAAPAETTSAIVLAAPSMLSKRLKALTTATIHTQVTPRSTSAPAPRCQPSPEIHTTQARASSTSTLHPGGTVRRSSTVPTTQSSPMPPTRGIVLFQSPAVTSTAMTKPPINAAPPRYGVGCAWPL